MTLFVDIQVLPVNPRDKKAAFAVETGWMLHRMDAFERSRAKAGWTLERVGLMETPIGNFTIAYHEATKSPEEAATTLRTSDDVFDRDMRTRGQVLHGLSEAEQLAQRIPRDLVIDYGVTAENRLPWIVFAAILKPGTEDRWRRACQDLQSGRRSEFDLFNRKNGYQVHRAALYSGARGAAACFYLEGTDPSALPRALAQDGTFERWFVEEAQAAFGADLRKELPILPVGICWDWVQGAKNEIVAPIHEQFAALFPG